MQPSIPVGVFPEVGEVGQHQIDAGHVEVGEHEPAVEEHDAPVDLDAGAVAADLPEAPEEDDPDRRQPLQRCEVFSRERTSLARVVKPVRGRTEGQPALAGGEPERPQHGFGGHGVGRFVAGLELVGFDQAGVDRPGVIDVALVKRRDHLLDFFRRPVRLHRDHSHRTDGEQRQGVGVVAAVELESCRRPGQQGCRRRPGCRWRP